MGHYAVDREFSIARYSIKNMIFHATWPTEWISHAVMMAWMDYLHTGNADLIKEFYTELKAKTLLALTTDKGLISTRTGLQDEAFLKSIHFNGKKLVDIVDWPNGSISEALKGGETDAFDFQDYNTAVNAFHYHSLLLMSKMALAIGQKQDASFYRRQADKVKTAFNKYFVDSGRNIYIDGISSSHASLHSNMYALAFGLVPESMKASVITFIKERKMACGVYGANYLLEALFDAGEDDYALGLLTSTTDRSWYNMLHVGSTMTTEAWDNKYKTDNGWSHAWSSSPAHIIPRKLMGIEPIEPGFSKIRIKPQPATLRQAAVKTPSIRGEIRVSFDNQPGEKFTLEVEIPANTTAEVWLPKLSQKYNLTVDNVTQKGRVNGDFIVVETGSGKHGFVIQQSK
jgi:hypothetical protein